MFDERDEQEFLDFDGDGESDLGERWSALQIFQECEEENACGRPHGRGKIRYKPR